MTQICRIYCKGLGLNIIFSIMISFFLITMCGCSGFVAGGKSAPSVDYQKGTKGISMGFVDGAPPDEVTVGNEFNIGVLVKNDHQVPAWETYCISNRTGVNISSLIYI